MTKLPPDSNGRPVPLYTRRVRPTTYSIAVYLVGLVIFVQLVAVGLAFWQRSIVVQVGVVAPKAVPANPAAPKPPAKVVITPVVPKPQAPVQSALPNLPSIESAVSIPARLTVPTVSDRLARINNLNDESQIFVHHNDLDTALQTLIKAEDFDPRNPSTLRNLAEVYSLRNNPVLAKIYWQRLVDLGPGVGTVYTVAKDDVLLLDSNHEADPLRQASERPRLLYIGHVEKTPVETLNGQPQFRLRAVLMRKNPKMPGFDQKRLQPFVVFYQLMPDGTLMPDLAQRKGSFEDTFLFWGGKLSEPFGVNYIMPVPGTLGPTRLPVGEYYGFVIGIYYDKELQDSFSEPNDLSTRMPLPNEIE